MTLLPCELVSRNGDRLRELVVQLAVEWQCAPAFIDWMEARVVWANSLVDRIVSEALEPVGAVAEPYALWAIEAQPGLTLPCRHPAIVVASDLGRFERLKLFLLNLGHTVLADLWIKGGFAAHMTVVQAMHEPALRRPLEEAWQQEVLPVFDVLGDANDDGEVDYHSVSSADFSIWQEQNGATGDFEQFSADWDDDGDVDTVDYAIWIQHFGNTLQLHNLLA